MSWNFCDYRTDKKVVNAVWEEIVDQTYLVLINVALKSTSINVYSFWPSSSSPSEAEAWLSKFTPSFLNIKLNESLITN